MTRFEEIKRKLTDLMDDESLKEYVFDRTLHEKPRIQRQQIEELSKVYLFNAYLRKDVIQVLRDLDILKNCEEYKPKKSDEAHFYNSRTGELFIVNPKGDTRRSREKNLFMAMTHILKKEISLQYNYKGGNRLSALREFALLGFHRASAPFKFIEKEKVEMNGKVNIIFGPHKNLEEIAAKYEVLHSEDHEYLNHKVLRIDDKIAIAFDYVYSDQITHMIDQILLICSANYRGKDINIFHYGKIGILNKCVEKKCVSGNAIFVPNSVIDELDIIENHTPDVYPVKNMLRSDHRKVSQLFMEKVGAYHAGTSLNAISLLRQKREILEKARDLYYADAVDMEILPLVSPSIGLSSSKRGLRRPKYFLAYAGSDKPLDGHNLGNTKDPFKEKTKIVDAFIEIIRQGYC